MRAVKPHGRATLETNRLFSLEAEAGLLGSIMIDPPVLMRVVQVISGAEMFFKIEHQKIYQCMILLMLKREPIDAVSLRTALKAKGWLADIGDAYGLPDELGGTKYIGQLLQSVPSSANAVYYAGVVADRYNYRQWIQVSEQIQNILQEHEETPVLAGKIQDLVLNQDVGGGQGYAKIDAKEAVEDMVSDKTAAIETGFRDIDTRVAFTPGDLVIIAARPSMGKSALATNIVQNMAVAGHGALIISLEMTAIAITKRLIARQARVNMRFLSDHCRDQIREAGEKVAKLPIYIAERVATVSQIVAMVGQVKAQHQIGVVVLDYIQLVAVHKATDSRNQDLAAISRQLKQIAMAENVVFLVVSQLNRQVENRADRRPRMSDLRDSGAIEQDADWILLLYRADYYRKPEDDIDGVAEINVAKARDGETGSVQMVFIPEWTSFENLARGS